MRYFYIALASTLFLTGICYADEGLNLEDRDARVSYSIGYEVGSDFNRQGFDINSEVLLKGVTDALAGNRPLMTHKEMRTALMDLQKKAAAKEEERMKALSSENLTKGMKFLSENSKKEGVHILPSGLQYKIITKGHGKKPKPEDTVSVRYRGTLTDGTIFDNSSARGEPATFRADRVIKGWKEALLMMKEGARWQLFIPPELAYGDKRTGSIEPNSTLLFEVELISVTPDTQQP